MVQVKKLSMSVKIIAATVTILVAVVAINYTVFMTGYKRDIQHELIDEASQFTALADETKNHVGKLMALGAFDTDKLVQEALNEVKAGKALKDTKFFNAIPVVAGWTAAGEAAKDQGVDFKVVAFDARNPKNEPEPGSFREQLLKDLTAQVTKGGEEHLGRIDPKTNTLHYVRAIKLDSNCMMCHGDPAKYDKRSADGTFDGLDPLGHKMENWKVGDMHGAFEIAMPLQQMDEQVAGFFKSGMMWTVPVVVGAIGFFVFMLRKTISQPIATLVGLFQKVASGDLTVRMETKREDEIGQLSASFNTVTGNLQKLVKECAASSQQVAAAASEIASSAEEMASGLSKQEEQTGQVSAAVEEMSASVVEVARKAADAAQAAEDSGKQATNGGAVVHQTIEEMKQIASQVTDSAKAVGALGQKSEQIGQIISVINDIADQTNLLALNAAIEAARAGEHGRGFAVVADEVRKLAERTTQATEEVAKSIREIQTGTGDSVQIINASTNKVSKGVDLANSAGSALETIVSGSKSLQGMVQSIATASQQQSAAGEQIAKSVEQISAVTRESTAGAQQAAQAATQLSEQAQNLATLVGRFKV